MEKICFLTYFLVMSVCVAVYIPDDNLNSVSSDETLVSGRETRLLPRKTMQNHPFPLNNLNNCHERSDKGPLNSLLGGLLPSLLSVLSKNHNTHKPGDNSYNNKCVYDRGHSSDSEHTLETNNEGENRQQFDDTNENQGSLLDADVSILDNNNPDAGENPEPNNPPPDIDADVTVLNGDQPLGEDMLEDVSHILEKEMEVPEKNTEGKNIVGKSDNTNTRRNNNLRSCKSCRDQGTLVDVDVLNDNNNKDEEASESQTPPLVDVDALNGEEILPDVSSMLGGILGRDLTKSLGTKRSKAETGDINKNNENNLEEIRKHKPDKANKYSTEDKNYIRETNIESPVEKIEVMRKENLNQYYSQESTSVKQDHSDKNKDHYISRAKVNVDQTAEENYKGDSYGLKITQSQNKNQDHKVVNFMNKFSDNENNVKTLNYEGFIEDNEEHDNLKITITPNNINEPNRQLLLSGKTGNEENFEKELTTENNNLGIHEKNLGSKSQGLSKDEKYNQIKKITPSQQMLSPNEESYFIYANQRFKTMDNDNQRVFKPFWLFIYTNQPFQRRSAFSKTPLKSNTPSATRYKRVLPTRIFAPFQHPSIPQFPHSVAGSSLYGSYAMANTMPSNGYYGNGGYYGGGIGSSLGGLGGGGIGSPVGGIGYPAGGLGTSVEEVQTSVQEVQTSVEDVQTSEGVIGKSVGPK